MNNENIILKILDDERNKIENILFLANKDISFLKLYKHFKYNVNFYKDDKNVNADKFDVSIIFIDNNKILIKFIGFAEKVYSKAVITSLSAYINSDELLIQLEHEITYTFSN